MRYKNIKTGAIVDSPFVINGDDWELLEAQKSFEEVEASEVDETELREEEFVEEEVDLKELTNDQLEKLAVEQGIQLTTADKRNKDTRIAAIVAGLE